MSYIQLDKDHATRISFGDQLFNISVSEDDGVDTLYIESESAEVLNVTISDDDDEVASIRAQGMWVTIARSVQKED